MERIWLDEVLEMKWENPVCYCYLKVYGLTEKDLEAWERLHSSEVAHLITCETCRDMLCEECSRYGKQMEFKQLVSDLEWEEDSDFLWDFYILILYEKFWEILNKRFLNFRKIELEPESRFIEFHPEEDEDFLLGNKYKNPTKIVIPFWEEFDCFWCPVFLWKYRRKVSAKRFCEYELTIREGKMFFEKIACKNCRVRLYCSYEESDLKDEPASCERPANKTNWLPLFVQIRELWNSRLWFEYRTVDKENGHEKKRSKRIFWF